MEIPIFTVDAFSKKPFSGNPAGVVLLEDAASPAWMQNVASETNLPVTAFVSPRPEARGFDLRWFTAAKEIPLCGHATLATAHTLWETGRLKPTEEARFETLSGALVCTFSKGNIEMDFPALIVSPQEAPSAVIEALGVRPIAAAAYRRPDGNLGNFLFELESEQAVRETKPDFANLRRALDAGVVITAAGNASTPYDIVSRYFAPYIGIDEDSVTGSAHCMLAGYWASKLGKNEISAYQASDRGGELRLKSTGDRVLIGGQAVTTLKGSLLC